MFKWNPDKGDGTYANPVIHADYSDHDVIRVGEDYWMTASSFYCTPGLPSGCSPCVGIFFRGTQKPAPFGTASQRPEMNGEAAVRGLAELAKLPSDDGNLRPLPDPLSPLPWEKAKTIAADGRAEFSGEWTKLTAADGPSCRRFGKKFYEWFPVLYRTSTPDSKMTVHFEGTHIGFKGMEGPDSGIVLVEMDDQPAKKKSLFTVYANQHVYVGSPLPAVPYGKHTVTWTLTGEVPPKEELLAKKKTDADFRNNPDKYKDNALSVGQIIVLGDLLDANGNVLP